MPAVLSTPSGTCPGVDADDRAEFIWSVQSQVRSQIATDRAPHVDGAIQLQRLRDRDDRVHEQLGRQLIFLGPPGHPCWRGSVSWAPGEQNQWTPRGDGGSFELSPILKPLASVKDQMIVLTNLEHQNAQGNGTDGNAEHTRSNASWLSAARPKMTEGADVRLATTVDQIAAKQLCRDTRLPSLELTVENSFLVGNCDNGYNCVYVNTLCWSSPTTPLPMENNPRLVFERLFGDGGTVDERRIEMRKDRSILDSVTEDMSRLMHTLGAGDRTRVSDYVDAVREVERRIQRAEKDAGQSTVALPDRPVGIPESYDEHVKLLFDLLVLTYQADITRVFSIQLGREQSARTFPWIGVNEGHHGVSHHQDKTGEDRGDREDHHLLQPAPVVLRRKARSHS